MRPTELKFRSPKEKTPDAGHPIVTFDGRKLSFSPVSIKGSFSQSKRFQQYEVEAKKTGFRVGPGTYNNNKVQISNNKPKGTPIFRKFHGGRDISNNGYFFYGHQLVFEPSFVLKSKLKDKDAGLDASQLLERAATTNSWLKDTPTKRTIKTTRPTSARSPYAVRFP
ncbi:hypothetical protein SteCoe_35006 [Stentor coeruleus]|uniref:Uncharacterized protein n=1 Tax=Stentor coeruleus TaxID=5963 RepID=A0A1R2ATH1_9CILI|nr:hypothetical protein SteCoe_35006 [Stentor coeruleus]